MVRLASTSRHMVSNMVITSWRDYSKSILWLLINRLTGVSIITKPISHHDRYSSLTSHSYYCGVFGMKIGIAPGVNCGHWVMEFVQYFYKVITFMCLFQLYSFVSSLKQVF